MFTDNNTDILKLKELFEEVCENKILTFVGLQKRRRDEKSKSCVERTTIPDFENEGVGKLRAKRRRRKKSSQ